MKRERGKERRERGHGKESTRESIDVDINSTRKKGIRFC